jgi:branched-chain amino acid transport system permease protein
LLLEDRYFDALVPQSVTRPVLWGRFDLASPAVLYYLCLSAFILVLLGLRNLRASRAGRAIIGLRENEPATMAAGVAPTMLKIQVFGMSGAIAGLAGALYVLHQLGLNTESFGPDVSLKLFSMVVVGGVASLSGALLGAGYITGGELLFPPGWSFVISGVGILLLLMFAPGGLSQLLFRMRDWILTKLSIRDGVQIEAPASTVSLSRPLSLEAR